MHHKLVIIISMLELERWSWRSTAWCLTARPVHVPTTVVAGPERRAAAPTEFMAMAMWHVVVVVPIIIIIIIII